MCFCAEIGEIFILSYVWSFKLYANSFFVWKLFPFGFFFTFCSFTSSTIFLRRRRNFIFLFFAYRTLFDSLRPLRLQLLPFLSPTSLSLFIQKNFKARNRERERASAFLVNKLHFPIPIFGVRFLVFFPHQFLFVFLSVHFAMPENSCGRVCAY